eukprot:3062700-Prymnesium_polylepis.1
MASISERTCNHAISAFGAIKQSSNRPTANQRHATQPRNRTIGPVRQLASLKAATQSGRRA